VDPIKQFNDSAASYGIGVAVLLCVVVGLLLIIWKFGNRLVTAHENYLVRNGEEMTRQTEMLNVIQMELKATCKAQCPAIDGRPKMKPRPTT
jgi:hypothetical protein